MSAICLDALERNSIAVQHRNGNVHEQVAQEVLVERLLLDGAFIHNTDLVWLLQLPPSYCHRLQRPFIHRDFIQDLSIESKVIVELQVSENTRTFSSIVSASPSLPSRISARHLRTLQHWKSGCFLRTLSAS